MRLMKIEKILDDLVTEIKLSEDKTISKKINEIIDYLSLIQDRMDLYSDKLKNIYDYIDYFKEHAILEPECEPDDVAFQRSNQEQHAQQRENRERLGVCETAKKGTFEWALIQLKNGKDITRKDSGNIQWIAKNGVVMTSVIAEGMWDLEVWDIEDVMADDWEVVE